MAFRKLTHDNRRLPLVSLIDLIFILLIFFIITSVMIKLTKGESRLYVPTPKNEPGEAQILLQIVDENQYVWLDHTAIDTLRHYRQQLSNPRDTEATVSFLIKKMTIDQEELFSRVEDLLSSERGSKRDEYFVLIRCPNDLPYFYATNVIEKLVDNPYFEYGCVAGTIDEIKASKRIHIEKNVLEIDF
ncbi:hypothetical protein GWO43_25270 [candidate division KSB1 bacterium]|nr:hypothetical protein [candidate division KSB1 bacterium]NIR68869.1 hypothetical protein [candidate division KSB1 bacterium]NIS27237.1 hypothetical protein [candidate division KSB1 bacterium]NIT74122.1 hypothetical protein [candidate division KSB1 bacterium]NIU27971.1 hypothetical protein [candidate division KSB1 bacterium]